METVPVSLNENSYEILIGYGLIQEIQKLQQDLQYQHRRSVIVTDNNVAEHQKTFLDSLFKEVPRHPIPAGEENKNIDTLSKIYDFLAESKLSRAGALFAFGGGVVGDIAGFAAATYMRGIDFYQIPTTLLAMVDSSIGGKSAINLKAGKNLVGAFHQPKKVFIDLNCLKSLPQREFASGMAEIIKHALIADEGLCSVIESNKPFSPEDKELLPIIKKSCEIKAKIVCEDERDVSGRRALLNLGHTFAHAIEAVAGYDKYSHGEAVAIGLVMAARLSEILGYISEEELARIRSCIEKYGLPTKLRSPLKIKSLIDRMRYDKKSAAGELTFIIIEKPGKATVINDVDEKWVNLILKESGAED